MNDLSNYAVSIIDLKPTEVLFVKAPPMADMKAISQLTQVLQTAFRPDQMKRVVVIPHDMEITLVKVPREDGA